MSVVVDTPIWSFAYRRRKHTLAEQRAVQELGHLIQLQEAWLIGPVRQEVLSGFPQPKQFSELRRILRSFEDLEIETADYELAAELTHKCRRRGVQGSPTDFLICALSLRYQAPVFTTDGDFKNYAPIIGIQLYQPIT